MHSHATLSPLWPFSNSLYNRRCSQNRVEHTKAHKGVCSFILYGIGKVLLSFFWCVVKVLCAYLCACECAKFSIFSVCSSFTRSFVIGWLSALRGINDTYFADERPLYACKMLVCIVFRCTSTHTYSLQTARRRPCRCVSMCKSTCEQVCKRENEERRKGNQETHADGNNVSECACFHVFSWI